MKFANILKEQQKAKKVLKEYNPDSFGDQSDRNERMDGLIDERKMEKLIIVYRSVYEDLAKDGFDDDEIFEFINERLKMEIN